MAEQLQRSEISFRRQGSSGLIWDDKLVAGALQNQTTKQEGDDAGEPRVELQRSRSTGGGGGRPYRTVKVPSPTVDPPSPKFSGCCGMFGKPVSARHPKPNRRRS